MRGINCYKLDLNDYSSISRNVELIKRRGFKLDFIVANAAVGCDRG
jgi:short-subunit dehydrogenase